MDFFETIQSLTQCPGPSGREEGAAAAALALLRPLVDEAWQDRLGNVLGVKRCGRPDARKVLLDAHLDEVGLVVTGYDGPFLRVASIGGIDPRVLVDRQVELLTQPPVRGILAAKLPEEPDRAPEKGELRIDLGLPERTVRERVPIGTPAVYVQPLFQLGEGGLAGKSLDDRCCFALLLRTLELIDPQKLDVDLYVLGSMGEETDSRGAITAARRIAPDCAVAVDVTFAKSPDCTESGCFPLGEGPALGVGPNVSHWMLRRLRDKAAALEQKVQLEVMAGSTGTNGWDMQIQAGGIAVALVSVPLRYMHTPIEVISGADLEHSARLLSAFVEGIGEEALSCWS